MPKAKIGGGLAAFLALVGAIAGSLTGVLLAGYAESEKLEALRRSEAIDAFIEASWDDPNSENNEDRYQKLLNKVVVYAPATVLSALRDYQLTDCAERGDPTRKCRELWANVAAEMRAFTGAENVESDLIVNVLWGRAALHQTPGSGQDQEGLRAEPPDPVPAPDDFAGEGRSR